MVDPSKTVMRLPRERWIAMKQNKRENPFSPAYYGQSFGCDLIAKTPTSDSQARWRFF